MSISFSSQHTPAATDVLSLRPALMDQGKPHRAHDASTASHFWNTAGPSTTHQPEHDPTRPSSPSSSQMPLHGAQLSSQSSMRSPASAQHHAQPWSPSAASASPTAEHSRPHQSAKRKHAETDSPTQPGANKAPRLTQESTSHDPQSSPPQPTRDPARVLSMTTVVCLHAAVAQKSYGSEKRFLCPPPLVRIEGHPAQLRHQQLIMSIISESGERTQEQRAAFDDHLSCSFKYLHVGNTSKAKSFQLELDIADPFSSPSSQLHSSVPPRTWAQFDSAPVSIISKPSKKTAKTRNVSSCILAGGPVSLFNRVNAQTVRTKYMMIEGGSLCASNASWSAFTVNVIRRPAHETPHIGGPEPVIYGCEIVLTDQATGISTGPLLVRKVDKGRIVPDDGGPVSQMQKIALQRANTDGTRSYLSAAGPHPGAVAQGFVSASPTSAQGSQHGISVQLPSTSNTGGIHPLLFQAPRIREEADSEGTRVQVDEVDDYICWTIVGISKFQYTFFDAYGRNTTPPEPITPFPTLFTAPVYRPTTNTMELTISNFFYDDPKTNQPAPLEVWLGDIGPLRYRIYQAVPTGPLQPFQVPRSGLEDSPPPPGQQALGEMPGAPISPVSDRSSAGAIPAIPPRHYNAGPAHTIVIVEMPTVGEIISSIGETVPPQGDDAEGALPESGMTPRHDPATLGPLLARGLPIFFIRPYDGTGYHAGRSVACENIFQTLNIGGDGAVNQAWIAAAQAAQHDGTAHGWTLRVV